MSSSLRFWIGVLLFVVGGVLLAAGGDAVGAPVGTVVGLAGLGLIGWAWLTREQGDA